MAETILQGKRRLLHHLPPTAVAVESSDIWRGLSALLHPDTSEERFRKAFIEQAGSSNCFLVSSGRAALALTLMSLKQFSDRTQVIVPAYVCPTVVQSVLKAGLNPVFCDVAPETLGLDRAMLGSLVNNQVLAVIPAHLYGWAEDVRDIIALGKQNGFYVIEDAAQAFGAKLSGRMVGAFGDAGYYSFGRGKCIPVGHGGVIVSQDWCASAIAETIEKSTGKAKRVDIKTLALFAAYGMATHPAGWWFITRSKWNPAGEGMDILDLPPISLGRLSSTQAQIGLSLLQRIERVQGIRQDNARRLIQCLAGLNGLAIPQISPDAEPVFLRLPVLAENEQLRNQLFELLWQEGIGVSRSYWHTIPDLYPDLSPPAKKETFPGAYRLAGCLLTLPTHSYLKEEDVQRTVAVFTTVSQKMKGNGGSYASPTA